MAAATAAPAAAIDLNQNACSAYHIRHSGATCEGVRAYNVYVRVYGVRSHTNGIVHQTWAVNEKKIDWNLKMLRIASITTKHQYNK